jgi:hypothetical protein
MMSRFGRDQGPDGRRAAAALLCAAAVIVVALLTPGAARTPGDTEIRVADRTFERDPSADGKLQVWAAQSPDEARRYVTPVLFPLDAIYMLALAGFTAIGSRVLAKHARLAVPGIAWLLLPVVYLTCDAAEDVLLAMALTAPASSGNAVAMLPSLTRVKIATAGLALAQVALLAIVALWRAVRPASDS